MNLIQEWMTVLGLKRQEELAQAVGRHKSRVSIWKREGIPPEVVHCLYRLAQHHHEPENLSALVVQSLDMFFRDRPKNEIHNSAPCDATR